MTAYPATRATRAIGSDPVSDGTAQPPRRPAAVQLRARRNTRLTVIGVLCVCLGALGMAWAWTGAQQSQSVVLVANAVGRGEAIEAGDLTTTTIGPAPGVATLPADQLSGLIGQYAQVDLPVGALVGPDAVGDQAIPAGSAQVGLRLAPGRVPHTAMAAGSQVLLVAVSAPNYPEAAPSVQYEAVVVGAPQLMSDGQTVLLDVRVGVEAASAVAALAAGDRIAVVRKADG